MGEWTVSGNNEDDDDKPKRKPTKAVPRRSALKTTGLVAGGVIGLTAAGLGARVYQTGALKPFTEGPGFDSLNIWQQQLSPAPTKGTKAPLSPLARNPKGLVAAGLLAASPHNSQPWRFAVRDNIVDVLADETRNLGVVDPRRREMTIGLGCCIENMVLGASAVGISPLLNVLPDGPDGKTIARLTVFDSVSARTKESEALGRRHTNRGPYVTARQVESKTISTFEALVSSASTKLIWLRADSDAGRRFAEGTVKATADFIADPEMVAASDKWFRFGPGQHRDGLTMPGVGLPPLITRMALMLPKGLAGDPHKAWLDMTRDVHVATAPVFGLLVVPSLADRAALIEAGRLWQRMHVHATLQGLAVQPLNQLMEMADRDAAQQRPSAAETTLKSLATLGNDTVAFAFRMGYSRFMTNPSPRRGMDAVMAV
jgi:hypothetical protein